MFDQLSTHIIATHAELGMPAPALPIFAGPEPVLRKDRVNKILYFMGGFNPPHIAHRQELTVALKHSFAADNLLAALIGPIHDSYTRKKATEAATTNESGRDLWLSCEDRAALWAGAEKTWAVPTESRAQFTQYMVELQRQAWVFSYEIELVMVVGVEYVKVRPGLVPFVNDTHVDIACSNAGTREAIFEDEDGIPQKLAWCDSWRLVEETGEGEDQVKLWACGITNTSGKQLRYVQYAQPPMLGQKVSATMVREMVVAGGNVEQAPLKSLVLRPDLLARMTWNQVER